MAQMTAVVDPEREEVRVDHLREDPDLPKVILRSGDVLKTSLLPGFEVSVKRDLPALLMISIKGVDLVRGR